MPETPEQLSIFDSGAKRSGVAPRFDLIPREALEALAKRLTLGAAKFGEFNWQKAVSDPTFQRDVTNHLMAHLLDFQLQGNSMQDNTAAIITNAAFLCYFEAKHTERDFMAALAGHVEAEARIEAAAETMAAMVDAQHIADAPTPYIPTVKQKRDRKPTTKKAIKRK